MADVSDLIRASLSSGLAVPLARVREELGAVCELLDQHVAHSRGPDPLPRAQVAQVREVVADAYMLLGRCARLAADLAAVVEPGRGDPAPFSVNEAIERAVALATPGLGDTDLRLDLGSLPDALGHAADLVHVVARLLLRAADTAAPTDDTVTVTTRRVDAEIVVVVAEAGEVRLPVA